MSPSGTKSQPVLLTGSSDFLSWRRETMIYIAGKGLDGHLDGSLPEPASKKSPEWRAWRQNDMKCMVKVRDRIAVSIRGSIGYQAATSRELWLLLQSRYGKGPGYQRLLAMRDIYLCQRDPNKSVSAHLAKVTRLVGIARQYGCEISPCDEAWFVVLNLDEKFTSMSMFHEIHDKFTSQDVESLKMRIEDEERRLGDLKLLKRGGERGSLDDTEHSTSSEGIEPKG
ncbi:hypothetical protein LEN26_018847 [Aphanomyces euteiches]|nr:hypothetical protein LEN26_018847 [Aphanomyces euteiches]